MMQALQLLSLASTWPHRGAGHTAALAAARRGLQAGKRPASQIEEIAASGDKVMVVIRTPGIDREHVRQAADGNYLVLTLDQGADHQDAGLPGPG
jgi:hypothetical protein